jgi:hypothetical protein
MAIKVFITYRSCLRLCDRYISVYVLLGCSTVVVTVVTVVTWGNCMLGSFLRIWTVLLLTFLLSYEGYTRYSGYHCQVGYSNLMFVYVHFPVLSSITCLSLKAQNIARKVDLWVSYNVQKNSYFFK